MSDAEAEYIKVGTGVPDSVQSQMFGKPCFKIGGKAFCSFFQEAMVFKLKGDIHARALALEGSVLFDPSGKGRAMREWVQVPMEHKALWPEFATAACEYVSG
jgi:hypothetical protein